MKVIVPCAGSSSRFPNMAPKWMLPDHDGVPMVVRAVAGLECPKDMFVFTILNEHEEKFNASEGLRQAFGGQVECLILDAPTDSQSETVAETIKRCKITGPFLVKDSDNFFELTQIAEDWNYISVASLNDFDMINARNKSYVQIDQDDLVTSIREKHVISDLFSVGGYYFHQADEYINAFNSLSQAGRFDKGELYLSEIIAFMILNGSTFQIKRAVNYQDWGTINEWKQELSRRRLHLVSLDGFLFERGSAYFTPSFVDAKPNEESVRAVRKMFEQRQAIIYLSIRPEKFRNITMEQFGRYNIPPAPIMFDCSIAQWSLITSAHPSLPFNTSQAFEIAPADPNILDKLDLLKSSGH